LGCCKKPIQWTSQFFTKNDFLSFVNNNDIEIDFGNTQFNCKIDDQVVKIHGNPVINHHDWVVIVHEGHHMLCHILCFVNVSNVTTPCDFHISIVDNPGVYVICHYVNQDVFSNDKPKEMLYGNGNVVNYQVDQNCDLIQGWAKHISTISGNQIPCCKPKPTLAMFNVDTIVSTCIGIEDCVNGIPHSYIFCQQENYDQKYFRIE